MLSNPCLENLVRGFTSTEWDRVAGHQGRALCMNSDVTIELVLRSGMGISFTIVNYSLKEELLLIGESREFSPMEQNASWSSERIRDYTRKYQIAYTVNTL
ncbi:hypothetical protein PVL30_000674 [Lodderomyces elongisporus]|uniref:uncharacterized protein n=1 Tax=Lodderomyces elongisporus TaxID=36914 RepID=UPI002922FC90|nr:uncharacterized protein PVL30_000674 [Lodderomyces elongisporus]WLF76967.1 hypothetical protein PVL30_000674 [Lodderomyces elongisporus]